MARGKTGEGHELPLRPFKGLIGEGGAERISTSAVKALRDMLEDAGVEIAKLAVGLAGHAGRETVKDEDIALAFDHWKR